MRARALLLVVLGLVVLAAGRSAAVEATPQSFTVTPSRLEIRLEPGHRAARTVRVYNNGPARLLLTAYVGNVDLPPSDLVGDADVAFSASRWLSLGTPTVVLAPGDHRDVPVVVDVPADVAPGGYHAAAYFQTASPPPAGAGVLPSARIGATVLVDVAPEDAVLTRAARVADMHVRIQRHGLLDSVVETDTTVENDGLASVVIGGLHTYRGWPGNDHDRAKVGPHLLLRGTQHTLSSSFRGTPLFGRVTVTAEIVYQRGPNDIPAIVLQRQVWIVPWRLLGVAAIALLVLVFTRRARRARRRHRHGHVPLTAVAPHPVHVAERNTMTRALLAAVLVLLAGISLAPPAGAASTKTIELTADGHFSPTEVTVSVGDTVTFHWAGGFHNVKFDDGENSGAFTGEVGTTWSRRFASAGNFPFICEVHGLSMTGTVTVDASPAVATSPAIATPASAALPAAAAPAAPTFPFTGPEGALLPTLGWGLLACGALGVARRR